MRIASVLVLALTAPLAAAPADPTQSAAAVEALRQDLAANPAAPPDVAGKSFAGVPLTKADAAAARDLIWKAHAAFIAKDRAAEVRDRLLKDGKMEMPFFMKTFGTKP